MKKIFFVLTALIVAMCCFAGCSDSNGADLQNGIETNGDIQTDGGENMDLTKICFVVDGTPIDVTLFDNVATRDLFDALKSGEIVVNMSRYGGFEQVGSLGRRVKSADSRTTTHPGDIVLYSSNQIVMFFGSNTWSYTRLGHINMTEEELESLLDKESVRLVISLG